MMSTATPDELVAAVKDMEEGMQAVMNGLGLGSDSADSSDPDVIPDFAAMATAGKRLTDACAVLAAASKPDVLAAIKAFEVQEQAQTTDGAPPPPPPVPGA